MGLSEGLSSNPLPLTDDSVSQSQRREITRNQRLFRRVKEQFTSVVLIGDIPINDDEYGRLIEYVKMKCQHIIRSGRPIDADPVFATALVQIGIRQYDGNYWGHVERLIDKSIAVTHQRNIGKSFVTTLRYYNKKMIDNREWVNNILLHGFVSNHYAFDLFEFLFKYYDLDLERDLERNTSEMMDSLIEIAQRNDNTGRTYLLVKQTANALAVDNLGGRIRFGKLLNMIDKAFWEQITPQKPTSRLAILFSQWIQQSEEFKLQFNSHTAMGIKRGRKSFSAPYIHCDFRRTEFVIKLPTQLIKVDDLSSVYWKITIGERPSFLVETDIYPAVTGFKTEEYGIPLSSEDLFESIEFELIRDGECIRSFRMKSDCIRFFDSSGDFIDTDKSLPRQKVYSFTRRNETPISDALIENEPIKGLVRSYFELEEGDIVRLPNGYSFSVGKQVEEGLMYRKRIPGVVCLYDGVELPVFSQAPSILLKINDRKANGTLIRINNKRFRLFDVEATRLELNERSGDAGYLINLDKHGCTQDGRYQVYIDVPNDRTNRSWEFVLMTGFAYEYEDSPYIFQTRGTIRFPESFELVPYDVDLQKNFDENSYNFEILPDRDRLSIQYKTESDELTLLFDVPVLRWKFDDGLWQVERPGDLWYTELPQFIYLKYPEANITLSLDDAWEDEDGQEKRIIFRNIKFKETYECDLTRVRSWLGRERILRLGFLEIENKKIEFLRIFTKSIVVSCILKGDFENNILEGELTIVGKSNYYVDVLKLETNEVLAEKLLLQDGYFAISHPLGSGLFNVKVYEDEEDDSGFGLTSFNFVDSIKQSLTNPYDLRGKLLAIRCVKKGIDSLFQMSFMAKYEIRDLEWVDEGNLNLYKGRLYTLSTRMPPINVTIEFPNLNQLQYAYLTFFDGYDNVEFLYDHHRKFIVRSEQKGLSRSVRYRRYESLYPEEYVYVLDFVD